MNAMNLEQLYKITIENLDHMKELIIEDMKRGTYSDGKYNEVIDQLNQQYKACKDALDKIHGFKI